MRDLFPWSDNQLLLTHARKKETCYKAVDSQAWCTCIRTTLPVLWFHFCCFNDVIRHRETLFLISATYNNAHALLEENRERNESRVNQVYKQHASRVLGYKYNHKDCIVQYVLIYSDSFL